MREAGASVRLITDGDVAPSIAASRVRSTVDLLMGVGGTPEGVISAAAIKCLGGAIQGKLWPRNDEERQALVDAGYDLDRVLTTDDLVAGEDVFVAATGVTDGALLTGVHYTPGGATTESSSCARAPAPSAASRPSTPSTSFVRSPLNATAETV